MTGQAVKATRHMSLIQRMNLHLVEMPNGCIEWSGATNARGYGTISSNYKQVKTHRQGVSSAGRHGPLLLSQLTLTLGADMKAYLKAIVATLIAGLGSLQVAFPDGVTAQEWMGVAMVMLVSAAAVYAVPNAEQP